MAPNQYIVRAKGKIETDQGHISNIYKSEGNEPIIVLPRIVLVLNEGRTITPILRRFRLAYLFMANPLAFNLKKGRKATQGLPPFFNSLLFFFSQVQFVAMAFRKSMAFVDGHSRLKRYFVSISSFMSINCFFAS